MLVGSSFPPFSSFFILFVFLAKLNSASLHYDDDNEPWNANVESSFFSDANDFGHESVKNFSLRDNVFFSTARNAFVRKFGRIFEKDAVLKSNSLKNRDFVQVSHKISPFPRGFKVFQANGIPNFNASSIQSASSFVPNAPEISPAENPQASLTCDGAPKHIGFKDSCSFLNALEDCESGGLYKYLKLYYCTLKHLNIIRIFFLIVWPLALFFMLGNTAADFFCPALEKLSEILRLPPTLAGVTLLPLGNGSADVFASIASFAGAGAGQVGLNSILGAGVVTSMVVAGSICLIIGSMDEPISVDKFSFFRDTSFYLLALLGLLALVCVKTIDVRYAVGFMCIYVLYATVVAISEIWRIEAPDPVERILNRLNIIHKASKPHSIPLLSMHLADEESMDSSSQALLSPAAAELSTPISEGVKSNSHAFSLSSMASSSPSSRHHDVHTALPQWRWTSNVAIYSQSASLKSREYLRREKVIERESDDRPLWGWMEEDGKGEATSNASQSGLRSWNLQYMLTSMFITLPLIFPRRITIPVGREGAWSYPCAIASTFSSPLLLAFIASGHSSDWKIYAVALLVGIAASSATFMYTSPGNSPSGAVLVAWVFAEFIMSILWFYVIANELVAYLVFAGIIFRLDSALLGLTVLAWGNSVGDATANLALACSRTHHPVQIAWSGCYAGPLFNIFLGLGMSFIIMTWRSFPKAFVIPEDPTLPWTIGFAALGLISSMVILPLKNMRLTKTLGIFLILLYASFVVLRGLHVVGKL